jgi:hypothetical protein
VASLSTALGPPSRAALSALSPEQREKEDVNRVTKQRPLLRVCAEFALVGIIKDAPDRSGGEWIMKVLKELVGPVITTQIDHPDSHIAIQRSVIVLTASLNYFFEVVFPPVPWHNTPCILKANFRSF